MCPNRRDQRGSHPCQWATPHSPHAITITIKAAAAITTITSSDLEPDSKQRP
jgi:hypothetical protein